MINGIDVSKLDSGHVIESSELFDLIVHKGVGVNATPYTDIRVRSKGIAKDWGVEIQIRRRPSDFNGNPVECECTFCYINYAIPGNRHLMDIRDFIYCLQSAVEFREQINELLHLEDITYD